MNHSLQDAILQVCHVTAFQWDDSRRIGLSYWPVSGDGVVLALKVGADSAVRDGDGAGGSDGGAGGGKFER